MKHLISLCMLLCMGCSSVGQSKSEPVDPGQAAADIRKGAMVACLSCRLPGLSDKAVKACEDLEPVCSALSGMCEEPNE